MKDEKHIDIIRNFRKDNGITPVVQHINILQTDKTGKSNYLYLTYNKEQERQHKITPNLGEKAVNLGEKNKGTRHCEHPLADAWQSKNNTQIDCHAVINDGSQ